MSGSYFHLFILLDILPIEAMAKFFLVIHGQLPLNAIVYFG